MNASEILEQGKSTLLQEGKALTTLAEKLDNTFVDCVNTLFQVKGRIIVTGMGKSGHIARKIAATLSSTGTPSFFIHPSEASHGDLGMMTARDALIAVSNSGNTAELSDILLFAQENKLPIIAITANPNSPLGLHAKHCLLISYDHEACPIDCAPTTSTTLSLGLGDALAMALMKVRGFTAEDFKSFHPGGSLGQKLLRVKDVMHTGSAIPLVGPSETMQNVLLEMSSKLLGCVGVIEGQHLVGIITDGDLRRAFSKGILASAASDVMTRNPKSIDENKTVSEARRIMHDRRITSMFITKDGKPEGIIHIHDCK